MGKELRGKGVNIVFTPQVSPLGRFPEGGHNWESFSPDQYLTSELISPMVQGMQDNNLTATTRHLIANEQERFRWKCEALQNNFMLNESISVNLDDRMMHEIYLWYVRTLMPRDFAVLTTSQAFRKRHQSWHRREHVFLRLNQQQLWLRKLRKPQLCSKERTWFSRSSHVRLERPA